MQAGVSSYFKEISTAETEEGQVAAGDEVAKQGEDSSLDYPALLFKVLIRMLIVLVIRMLIVLVIHMLIVLVICMLLCW